MNVSHPMTSVRFPGLLLHHITRIMATSFSPYTRQLTLESEIVGSSKHLCLIPHIFLNSLSYIWFCIVFTASYVLRGRGTKIHEDFIAIFKGSLYLLSLWIAFTILCLWHVFRKHILYDVDENHFISFAPSKFDYYYSWRWKSVIIFCLERSVHSCHCTNCSTGGSFIDFCSRPFTT